MKHSTIRLAAFRLATLGAVALFAAACSSDNKNNNPTPSNGMGGSAATGGAPADATGGAPADATGGAPADATGGAPSTDATGGAAATGGVAATGGASSTATTVCTHDPAKNCYECTPTTNDQILTACSSTATCYPFDNTARGVPATLPAIP